jgi:hypothetical protein
MKGTISMLIRHGSAVAIAIIACTALTDHSACADTTTFVSDTSWSVMDALNNPVGNAQYVVLNNAHPTVQPSGATNYGCPPSSTWQADVSTIPGAGWIWAPGIIGTSPNASLATYSFSHSFFLGGLPTLGTISLAVDDSASIFVNGNLAGSVGSITDASVAYQAQSALTTFNITPYLQSGQNTILISSENGPDSFPGIANSDYAENPAGLVFGGTISSQGTAVPEPCSFALLALGLLPVALAARKRSRRA